MDTFDALKLLACRLDAIDALAAEVAELRRLVAGPGVAGFLSVADAAKFSGLSKTVLYRLRDEGRLSHHKVGGKVLIERAELVALVRGER